MLQHLLESLILIPLKNYGVAPLARGGIPAGLCAGILVLGGSYIKIMLWPNQANMEIWCWLADRTALISFGIVSLAAAAVWVWIHRNDWFAVMGIFFLGMGAFFVLKSSEAVRDFPLGRLVVAVAQFRPIGASKYDARAMTELIVNGLSAKRSEGVPLEVKELPVEVEGATPEEQNAHAVELFKVKPADMLVWGDVIGEGRGRTIAVRSRFCGNRDLTSQYRPDRLRGSPTTGLPYLEHRKRSLAEVTEFVWFLCADAYFLADKYPEALKILEQIQSREGWMLAGLCWYSTAAELPNPKMGYEQAISAYEKGLRAGSTEPPRKKDISGWWAFLMRIGAYLALAEISEPKDARMYLERAESDLSLAEQMGIPEEFRDLWAKGRKNLAIILGNLGAGTPGAEGNKLLERAADSCRVALQVYTRENSPKDWAVIQDTLGTALSTLGGRTAGDTGDRLLQQALDALDAALQVRTRQTSPKDWARSEWSRGMALGYLGWLKKGDKGIELLNEAIRAYDSVLPVFDATGFPRQHEKVKQSRADLVRVLEVLKKGRP